MTDPYLDPDTGILRNKVGARIQAELDATEVVVTAIRDVRIAASPIPGNYDLAHLQEFHRQLFSDVYDWAGKLRTVNIEKQGTVFCFAQNIESWAAEGVQPKIVAADYLRGLDHAEVVAGLADLFAEVNLLHPFREGNGRTQRAFFRQMCAAAGWTLDWAGLDADDNIIASHASGQDNLEPLIRLLEPRLSPIV